jgi:hypothetical protein
MTTALRLTGVVSSRGSAVLKALGDDQFEGIGTGMISTRTNAVGFIRESGGTCFDPPWSTEPGGQFQLGKKWSARTIRTGAMSTQNGDRPRQTIGFDPSRRYGMKVVTQVRSSRSAPNITIREVTARSRIHRLSIPRC